VRPPSVHVQAQELRPGSRRLAEIDRGPEGRPPIEALPQQKLGGRKEIVGVVGFPGEGQVVMRGGQPPRPDLKVSPRREYRGAKGLSPVEAPREEMRAPPSSAEDPIHLLPVDEDAIGMRMDAADEYSGPIARIGGKNGERPVAFSVIAAAPNPRAGVVVAPGVVPQHVNPVSMRGDPDVAVPCS